MEKDYFPAGLSFAQFTLIVNSVFEWEGYHLSDYYFGKVCEVVTNDTENNDFSLSFMDEPTVLDSATTIIDDYFDMKMDAVYTYDFGDNWEHKIHVEEILDDYDKNYAQVSDMLPPLSIPFLKWGLLTQCL